MENIPKRWRTRKTPPVLQKEMILDNATRAGLYHLIGILLMAGGILNLISTYFFSGLQLEQTLAFSVGLFLFGIVIQIIYYLKLSENMKDSLILLFVALLVPVVTLHYIEYASISVWAFPFALILVFTMFQNQKMLMVLSLSILATQILVWKLAPRVQVVVDGSDHIVRVALFCFTIWLGFYVNRIYRTKLQENVDQIRIQKLVADISSDLVTVSLDNIDQKMNDMLLKIGNHFQVDSCFLVLTDPDEDKITHTYEWHNDGIRPAADTLTGLPVSHFSWAREQILNNHLIQISDIAKVPVAAEEEKRYLEQHQIKSLISIPVAGQGVVQGILGFHSIKQARKWSSERLAFLKIAANVVSDALDKVKTEQLQAYIAYYDQLTDLPNRSLFRDKAAQLITRVNGTNEMLGVMFVDLDSFKTVNDIIGHGGGDDLLVSVSQKIAGQIRETDLVARFGGDEFLVLLNNIKTGADLIKIAEDILDIFKQPFMIKEQEFFITASAGISIYPHDGEEVDILIKNADMAMYHAKDRGKNQYAFCTADMKNNLYQTVEFTNSLYRALERNELVLYYQPQVSIQSHKIVGLEALLRWKHPDMGMIAPNIFIPLAERTGLINPIGEWVLKTACQQNKKWQDKGLPAVRIAVNLSFIQIRNPNLTQQVENILAETGLNPEFLELEITESVANKENNYIINVLDNLKRLGVSLSIDDFGTEYSSLSRLKLLPVDRIKMDRQFVRGIDGSEKDRAIVKIIISLAKNLGIPVIAEGVETQEQVEFLDQIMCEEAQGFLYFKPMTASEIEQILGKGLRLDENEKTA
ncbi:MAG: EAL domain-containing protein [Syntrophomonadaceae bacterium]|nr:EAL domain-containing protein [Syntrophomonadaceae bacterium]